MHVYTPIALGVSLALGSGMALAAPTVVAAPQVVSSGAVPAMPLKRALNEFAQREHLQLVYVSAIADGVRTQGASAGLSPQATLQELLRGTGLQYRYLNTNTVTISRADPPKQVVDPPQAATPAATAPPPKPETLQAIVVTGSHIRRAALETDNPVVTVTAQQIQDTGKLTLGDVLQELPAITGGLMSPAVNNSPNNNSGGGSTLVGLRGLGASRTLVLVDGQRVIKTPNGAVDLNTIPTAAIARIEVLTSGASAIYGSDAIGGVVNIILKHNYNGAQVQLNYGISSHNDAKRTGGSFIFGHTSDKGSILAGVSYQKFYPIFASARKFSRDALSTSGTINGRPNFVVGGSSFALRDFISVGDRLATKFGCPTSGGVGQLSLNSSAFNAGTSPTGSGDYHCFGVDDRYNFADVNLLVTPPERTNAFFNGDFHLSDNIDFYATYYHNKTRSVFIAAPALLGTSQVPGVLISKDSYYNPFGINFSAQAGGVYRSRLVPMGDRTHPFNNTTDQLITGFKGNFNVLNQSWQWDAGFNYGHTSTVLTLLNFANRNVLLSGLGPSFMNSDGVVQCGTPSSPISLETCTPWDAFNLNSPTATTVLPNGSSPAMEDTWRIERTYHVDANGGLIDLPAGTVQLAVGYQHRTEYTNNTVGSPLALSPTTLTCVLGNVCFAHLQGGFHVNEGYAELFVPILKDMPFAHGLNVTLADRYSDYSNFGSTSNWKIGIEWRPIEDLLLRGTVAKVFRAPTVDDLFASPTSASPFLSNDPCDGITVANPACVGVPLDGTFKDLNTPNINQLEGIKEGARSANLPLAPEKGKSFDLGIVYSPRFAPGLSATADVWRIYLNNTITSIGAQTVMNSCFAGNLAFCPLILRIPSGPNAGQINHIVEPTGNLGRIDVKGDDVDLRYRLPAFKFGQFTLDLHGSYLEQFKIQTAPGQPGNVVVNGAGRMGWLGSTLQAVCPFPLAGMCFMPRWRARGTVNWQRGPWSAQWTMRFIDKFSMAGTHETGQPLVEGLDQYGSYVYNNFMLGYDITPIDTSIQVGVDNAFNKQPPLLGANRTMNSNTDPEDFDVIGRFYWARMTVKF